MNSAQEAPRILLVDDDRDACTIMSRLLAAYGYRVDTAEGGTGALAQLRTNEYQLAILDYRMPGMNGVELFAKMREVRPEIQGIFLTGYPTVDTVFPAISEGIERVLAKPVDIKELLSVIKEVTANAA